MIRVPRGSAPPLLVAGGMLSISCTVPFAYWTARVQNRTTEPVHVTLSSSVSGREHETVEADVAPGAEITRTLAGNPYEMQFSGAVEVGGGQPPLSLEFSAPLRGGDSTYVIRRDGSGIAAHLQPTSEHPK